MMLVVLCDILGGLVGVGEGHAGECEIHTEGKATIDLVANAPAFLVTESQGQAFLKRIDP